MKYPKRSQYRYAKSPYRIRNWAEYEEGLRSRSDFTLWLSEDAINSWREPPSGRSGGQRRYADIAIEAALTIRMIFHLPLRQTEGFLGSLARMLEIDLPIPYHTSLSRRLKKLSEILPFRSAGNDRPIHLLIDSTGLRRRWNPTKATKEKGEGGVRVLIPPGRNAQLNPRPSAAQKERSRNIRSIRELGRRDWHTRSGYGTRSLVESAVFRYKTIMGRGKRSRSQESQRVEARLACKILR